MGTSDMDASRMTRSPTDAGSGISSGSSASSHDTDDVGPRVLIPFDRREALATSQAARIAGVSTETVRRWAAVHDIGRPVAGRWMVSRYALAMFLDGDMAALSDYHRGDRAGPRVRPYLERRT